MEFLQDIMVYITLITLLLAGMGLSVGGTKIEKKDKKIKKLKCLLDEAHVVIEAVANTKKKADRLELANKFTFKD